MIRASLLVGLAASALLDFSVPCIAKQADCSGLTKLTVAWSDSAQSTVSTTYVDVTGSNVSFTTRAKSCIVVSFSGVAFSSQEVMTIHALLDGSKVSADGDIQFQSYSQGGFADARSYDFVFPSVPAGDHSVKMQYHAFNGTGVGLLSFDMRANYK